MDVKTSGSVSGQHVDTLHEQNLSDPATESSHTGAGSLYNGMKTDIIPPDSQVSPYQNPFRAENTKGLTNRTQELLDPQHQSAYTLKINGKTLYSTPKIEEKADRLSLRLSFYAGTKVRMESATFVEEHENTEHKRQNSLITEKGEQPATPETRRRAAELEKIISQSLPGVSSVRLKESTWVREQSEGWAALAKHEKNIQEYEKFLREVQSTARTSSTPTPQTVSRDISSHSLDPGIVRAERTSDRYSDLLNSVKSQFNINDARTSLHQALTVRTKDQPSLQVNASPSMREGRLRIDENVHQTAPATSDKSSSPEIAEVDKDIARVVQCMEELEQNRAPSSVNRTRTDPALESSQKQMQPVLQEKVGHIDDYELPDSTSERPLQQDDPSLSSSAPASLPEDHSVPGIQSQQARTSIGSPADTETDDTVRDYDGSLKRPEAEAHRQDDAPLNPALASSSKPTNESDLFEEDDNLEPSQTSRHSHTLGDGKLDIPPYTTSSTDMEIQHDPATTLDDSPQSDGDTDRRHPDITSEPQVTRERSPVGGQILDEKKTATYNDRPEDAIEQSDLPPRSRIAPSSPQLGETEDSDHDQAVVELKKQESETLRQTTHHPFTTESSADSKPRIQTYQTTIAPDQTLTSGPFAHDGKEHDAYHTDLEKPPESFSPVAAEQTQENISTVIDEEAPHKLAPETREEQDQPTLQRHAPRPLAETSPPASQWGSDQNLSELTETILPATDENEADHFDTDSIEEKHALESLEKLLPSGDKTVDVAGDETSKSKPEELYQAMHREHSSPSKREQLPRQDSKTDDLRTKELSFDVPDTAAETTEPGQLSLTPEAPKGDKAANTQFTAPRLDHSQSPTLKPSLDDDSVPEATSPTISEKPLSADSHTAPLSTRLTDKTKKSEIQQLTTVQKQPAPDEQDTTTGEIEEIIEETILEEADHDQYRTQSPLGSHSSQRDRTTEETFVSEPGLDTQPTKPEETERTIAAKELPKALGESATDSPLTDPGAARSEKPEQTQEGIRDFFKSNVMGQISSFSSTKAKESDGRSTEAVTESARSTDIAPALFSEGHDPLSDHSQKPGAVSVGSLVEQHTITPDDGSATVAERKTSLEKRDLEAVVKVIGQ